MKTTGWEVGRGVQTRRSALHGDVPPRLAAAILLTVAVLGGLGGWWWTMPPNLRSEPNPVPTEKSAPDKSAPEVTAWILWVIDERWSSATSRDRPSDEHSVRQLATVLGRGTCESLAEQKIKAVMSAISFIGATLVGNEVLYAVDGAPSTTRFVCMPPGEEPYSPNGRPAGGQAPYDRGERT